MTLVRRKWSGAFAPKPTAGQEGTSADQLTRRRNLMALRSRAPGQWMTDHLTESARLRGAVAVAVKVLQDQAAEAEAHVYRWDEKARMGGDQDAKKPVSYDHPLCRLLRKPNTHETGGYLRRRIVQQLCLTGTSLQWRVDNGLGRPAELWSVPTGTYQPVPMSGEYPEGAYRVMPFFPGPLAQLPGAYSAGGYVISARQVVATRHPHPLVQWEGLSPLSACDLAMDTIESIDRARYAQTRRSFVPQATIELDPQVLNPPTDEEMEAIRVQLQQTFGGPDKAGGFAMLAPGMAAKPWPAGSVEVGWIESWSQLVSFVMAVYGVTKSLAFMNEDTSFASLYASLKQFNLFTLCPLLGMISDAYNLQLAWPFWGEDYCVEFKPKAISDDELVERQLSTDAGAGNVRTVDEVRALRGLEPFGDERGKAFFGAKPQPQGGGLEGLAGLFGQGKPQAQPEKPQEEKPQAEEVEAARPDNPEGEGSLGERLGLVRNGKSVGHSNGKAYAEEMLANGPANGHANGVAVKARPVVHREIRRKVRVEDDRQSTPWTCGPAAVMSVCHGFGLGPATEGEFARALGTTEKDGTRPANVLAFFRRAGLRVEAKNDRTLPGLKADTDAGRPVLCCIQDYGTYAEEAAEQSGHWVVVTDVEDKGDDLFVTFQDPAAGPVTWNSHDWLAHWEDTDGSAEFTHYGIAVWPPAGGKDFDESKHPRGQPGNAGQFGPGGGGKKPEKPAAKKPANPGAAEANKEQGAKPGPRVPEQKSTSEKAARAKAAHVLVGRDVQRYAEEYNEPRLAKALGGVSHPDSEPKDISTDRDLVELKTMVSNGNDKLTMDSYAQVRKIVAERDEGKTFHTIVSDDRLVYNAKGDGKHDDSKRVYYYRRGVAGSARVGGMYRCKDEAELKRLMATPEDQLPDAAKRTDGKLRVGRWKFFEDEQGKGYRNLKTGQTFRAKK